MSRKIEIAREDTTTSTLSSWRNGCASIDSTFRPLALASTSARSRMVTISWSRSRGDSSRSPTRAIRNTTSPTMPQMRYSWVQNRGSCTMTGTVALPTTATIRLPTTGPLVQKPMAVARPSCGEKSRIRAGVATRQIPSTMPTTKLSLVNTHLFVAAGSTNSTKIPVNSSPKTTRLARPVRAGGPGEQRAEGAEKVAEGQGHHEERKAHVQVGQDQRGHRAADVQ